MISRALATIGDHSSEANQRLFFSLLSELCDQGGYGAVDCISQAEGYAEPGYDLDNSEMPILFADWNSETRWNKETNKSETISDIMPLLAKFAEAIGCSIEWEDEWAICECNKAFRTSPDSYGWTMYGTMDGEYICGDCVQEDPEAYFEEISGNPRRAITIAGVDATEHGYVKINSDSFEHGLYGGQDSSPDAIAETLRSAEIEDFLFSIDSSGQFDLKFSVFVREDDGGRALEALAAGNTRCEVDPATALEQGLKEATKAMAQLKDEDGVKVATVNADGTASARTVSPEEFISGIDTN